MKFQHILFALFLILQVSCKDNTLSCPESKDYGTLLFKEDVKNFIPTEYKNDSSLLYIVFEDSLENSAKFTHTSFSQSIVNKESKKICADKEILYTYALEQARTGFFSDSLNITFDISMFISSPFPIVSSSPNSPASPPKFKNNIIFAINKRSDNSQIHSFPFYSDYDEPFPNGFHGAEAPLDEFEINGKTFYDVYNYISVDINGNATNQFFYNKEFGVVGFQDFDGKMWNFKTFQ